MMPLEKLLFGAVKQPLLAKAVDQLRSNLTLPGLSDVDSVSQATLLRRELPAVFCFVQRDLILLVNPVTRLKLSEI